MIPGLSVSNGLYGNQYGMQNYYNNPYFLQAYNSPNYNQIAQSQQAYNNQMANSVGQTNNQTNQQTNTSNVSFQGAQAAIQDDSEKEEKSSSGRAWGLALAATAIGTGWWLLSRGKARNANGFFNQIKTGFTSLFKDSKIIKGADISKYKEALGINEALKWTDEAAKLKSFQFELKNPDGVLNRITVKNGELANLIDLTQEATKGNKLRNLTSNYKDGLINADFKKQIDEIISMVSSKDISKLPTEVNLKNIQYTAGNNSGLSLYRAVTPDATNNFLFAKSYS